MIANITSEKESVVLCLDENRHGFQDGDYVTFQEVQGMDNLNSSPPLQIKVFLVYS